MLKIQFMKNLSKLTAILLALLLILAFHSIYVFSQTQSNNSSRSIYKFINGQWFDGKSFQPRTFYSVDGTLTKKKPRGDAETLDLANKWCFLCQDSGQFLGKCSDSPTRICQSS